MNLQYDRSDLLPLGVKRIVITGAKEVLGRAFQDGLERYTLIAAVP